MFLSEMFPTLPAYNGEQDKTLMWNDVSTTVFPCFLKACTLCYIIPFSALSMIFIATVMKGQQLAQMLAPLKKEYTSIFFTQIPYFEQYCLGA